MLSEKTPPGTIEQIEGKNGMDPARDGRVPQEQVVRPPPEGRAGGSG